MTTDEMLKLQGFRPERIKKVVGKKDLGEQIGNAMSVNVIEAVMAQALIATTGQSAQITSYHPQRQGVYGRSMYCPPLLTEKL